MKKLKLISMILIFVVAATGCWDKVEIEDRAFVLVMGVDKAEKKAEEEGEDRYLITLANPIAAEAKEGKVLEFETFDVEAPSYTIGITKLLQRFAQTHSYEHTKVFVLGSDLLEDENLLKGILDAFSRGHQFNTSMLIFMAHGKAADILKVKPKMKSLLGFYITGIADNERYAARIGKLTYLKFLKQLADTQGDAVMPTLEPSPDGLTSAYLGIIKDYKHIAHLNEKETVAYKWLNGEAKGGVIEVRLGDIETPYTYFTFKTKINVDKIEGGKIYLTYNMETEGSIEEYTLTQRLMDQDKLKTLEAELEKKIVKDSKELIKKMQEELKVDLLGVREYLYKHHPKLYESIKPNFDEYFETNIVIDVKVDAKVRRIGKTE